MMSTSPSRRLLAGLGTAALLLSGVAIAGSASAAGVCPTYTDDPGDAHLGPVGMDSPAANVVSLPTDTDPDLDILAVSHSVDDGVFSTVIKVTGLSDLGPKTTFYDRFLSSFTVAKKAVSIQADRDFISSFPGSDPVVTAVLKVGTVASTAKVTPTFDVKASTVTLKVGVADMAKAVGASLNGEAFSAMVTTTLEPVVRVTSPLGPQEVPVYGTVSGFQLTPAAVDTATAPTAASYVFGGSCSGGGTPVPGPTPTGTPDPGGDPGTEPTPEGSGPLFAFPRAGCFLYKDPSGDAAPGMAPLNLPQNDTDLDFTQVSVKSTPDAVVAYAKITALNTAPDFAPVFDGHKFTASMVINGKTITAVATGAGAATTTPSTAKATAVFDTKKSYVIFTFPKADLGTAAGTPIVAGTSITNLKWVSNATNKVGDFDGDTAAGSTDAEKTYAYGDNKCFAPPNGIVTIDTTGRGVYSDTSVVGVTVTDADENALPGVKVHLQLAGMPAMTLVTGDDGSAEFSFPVNVPAGDKELTATFLGTTDVGPAGAGASFTVTPDTSVVKAVAGKGSVTATVTDNDKTPLAGQPVAFKVGSKVTTVKTNAKGVAVLSKLAKGTSVSVTFAGVKDEYTATKPVTAKAL